jgi:2-oxo-4-hydroxy-4-carboxy-5-ureidoimidazoline decarboxylase
MTCDELVTSLRACCSAPSWIAAVLDGRPYASDEALYLASDAATLALDDADLALALAAHPRIGERPAGAHASWSRQEQSGMTAADTELRDQIAAANRAYEQHFGQVYLVCATGRSAQQLLEICRQRLANDPTTERTVVLGELAQIARLRLARLDQGALL